MIRIAALLVAGAVFAASVPAGADGIPVEKPHAAIKKIKKKRHVRKRVVIEKKKAEPPPVAAAPAPPPPPPPPPPNLVWVPGHWTWNPPMSMHVWVPGMYIPAPTREQERSLALRRMQEWIGIGRRY
jgi:hypothetical protein